MYKKVFTKRLPPGAQILDGSRASIPSRGGKRRIVELNSAGNMVLRSKSWYAKIGGKEVALLPDRDSSKELASHKDLDARRVSKGLDPVLPAEETQEKELAPLLAQWVDDQTMAGRNSVRVAVDKARVQWILKNAELVTVADLSRQTAGEAIAKALEARRVASQPLVLSKGDKFKPSDIRGILQVSVSGLWKIAQMAGVEGTGKGKAKTYTRAEALKLLASRKTTMSPVTLNGYRVSIGSFCRWLTRKGIIPRVPYAGRQLDERKDRRLVRRALSLLELSSLAKSTRAKAIPRAGLTGAARATLYELAFWTMLRRRALAELTRADCNLKDAKPWIQVRAETDKTGRARAIPIPPELAVKLRGILPKGINAPVWGPLASIVQALRFDLKAAGIPFKTAEGVADFHALRHSGATHFARKGVGLDAVAKIGGWKNLQMFFDRYGHYSVGSLADACRGAW